MSGKIDLTTIFRTMRDVEARVRALLFGAAGAGKTTSALGIALGLTVDEKHPEGQPSRVCLLDSERGSAVKAGRDMGLPFIHAEVSDFKGLVQTPGRGQPPLVEHDPRLYEAAVKAAADNFDVVIVDSLSHAWQACLEMLDLVARQSFGGNSHKAWAGVTPIWQGLLNTLLTAPAHIIVTARAKTLWADERNDRGRVTPTAIGTEPVLRSGAEYEFDLLLRMDADHFGHVTKARSRRFDGQVIQRPGVDFGRELAAWAKGGGEDTATWLARELGAAGLTTAALDAWRASINKPPMAQLTDVQVRQIVGLVLGSDLREKVRGFMGDAAQGAEG